MKKKILVISLPALLYVSLMIVFAFYDLDISVALLNKNSIFGKTFETIAEVPFNLIAISSFSLLLLTRNKDVKWKNIFTIIISIIGMLAYSFLLVFFVLNYLHVHHSLIYGFSFCLPIAVSSYFLMKPLAKRYSNKIRSIAIIAILTILIELALSYVLKYMWGRPRMRDLEYPYEGFKRWYEISFFSGNDSFPSGHSANAATIILLTLLPDVFFKNKKLSKILINVFCYAWIITVMISRVILGAHFSSDVLTGAGITLTIFYVLKNTLYIKLNKEESSQLV